MHIRSAGATQLVNYRVGRRTTVSVLQCEVVGITLLTSLQHLIWFDMNYVAWFISY